MKEGTEGFLNMLLWSAEMLARPTFRNLTRSYESWAYRSGLCQRLDLLEKKRLVEPHPKPKGERLYRLTESGRLHALGGRDPDLQWARRWDGQWRMVVFDIPARPEALRKRLRRYLRGRGFGCLQKSVWITPDPIDPELGLFGDGAIDVTSLTLFEARPCGGESDLEIVRAAWDFTRINQLYIRLMEILADRPNTALRTENSGKALHCWAVAEHKAWLQAVSSDPLLPGPILPPGYQGQIAWHRRKQVLQQAAEQLRTFRLGSV